MDVHEQRIGRYVLVLNREERKRIARMSLNSKQRPADMLFWLIWHWLQSEGIVTWCDAERKSFSP